LIRQQILERAGHRVLNATDGATALEIAARAIDLALLDYAMPDVNGGIILREMKRQRRDVPVIMVSARPLDRYEVDSADCLITKGQGPAVLPKRSLN
jgi:DNA-binding response OmpR family regulator